MAEKPLFQLLKWPLAGVAILGVVLVAYGFSLSVYTDFELASQLDLNACNENGVIDGWYDQKRALQTWRYPLMQAGISLVLAAGTLAVIIAAFGHPDKRALESPRQKIVFFGLGVIVFALSWFSQIWSLGLDLDRGAFPHCADSIAIPLYYINNSYFLLFGLSVAMGLLLQSFFVQLPVGLFAWGRDRPVLSTLITLPFALIALIIALLGVLMAASSAFLGTAAAILALYVTEATRSALIR